MAQQQQCAPSDAWARVKSRLRAELGEDVFASWFRGVEVELVDEEVVHLTVATRFLRNWLRSHYYEFVLRLSRAEWPTVERLARPGTHERSHLVARSTCCVPRTPSPDTPGGWRALCHRSEVAQKARVLLNTP